MEGESEGTAPKGRSLPAMAPTGVSFVICSSPSLGPNNTQK